ncbi:MAG TPA: hypothetical protein VG722_09625, partial [Tepidisphaeraceae bacterium]|nr:hypothetical protein [Tepidisphaeraceae bacterium]
LLPEVHVALASVRGSGTSLQFSSTDPVPVSSFIELLVPEIFGNRASAAYVGWFAPTEVRIYTGCTVFILAVIGAVYRRKDRWPALLMCVIFMISSMGVDTPVYPFLFRWLPGLSLFRESGRFLYIVNLFIVLLFAGGIDVLWRQPNHRPILIFALAAGVLWLGTAFMFIEASAKGAGVWGDFVRATAPTQGQWFSSAISSYSLAANQTAHFAAMQALRAAGAVSLLLMLLLFFRPIFPIAASVVAIVELFWIGLVYCPLHSSVHYYPATWTAAQKQVVGDQRVFTNDFAFADDAMLFGADDCSGYDPIVLNRYAEFLQLCQGSTPEANYISVLNRLSPLLQLLRCRFVLCTDNDRHPVIVLKHPLPHVLLIGKSLVRSTESGAFTAMNSPDFNMSDNVVVERRPAVEPTAAGARGTATVVSQGTDWLEIQADTPAPAMLLITDSYDSGWHAEALPDSSQQHYELIPADCTLEAIALTAGHHHLIVRYVPPGFYAGCVLSGLFAMVLLFFIWPSTSAKGAA